LISEKLATCELLLFKVKKYTKNMIKTIIISLIAIIVGMLLVGSIRMIRFQDDTVHYHANFGLSIDGKMYDFSNPVYMEEVSKCSISEHRGPKDRVHLHNNKGFEVHVHDSGATWAHLLANLGFGISDKTLVTDRKDVLIDGANGKRLSFTLNGKPISSIYNLTIANHDVLLISYGSQSVSEIGELYKQIPHNAEELNHTYDPAACSGGAVVPKNFFKKFWFVMWK